MVGVDRYRRLAALNADRDAFMAAIGSIVEHSSWVAERAFVYRPFSSIEALHGALSRSPCSTCIPSLRVARRSKAR
jgi:2-oxo-4-hydroxy-4-carboxy--5-ureidoimidazoline (OHCU) decarboxylase